MNERCITGLSLSGQCGAAAYCNNGYSCCAKCPEDCNIRCGWLDGNRREQSNGKADKTDPT